MSTVGDAQGAAIPFPRHLAKDDDIDPVKICSILFGPTKEHMRRAAWFNEGTIRWRARGAEMPTEQMYHAPYV
jgi:hypothetical protein